MPSDFVTYGPRLFAAGYSVIPIAKGQQYPAGGDGVGWRDGDITAARLNAWHKQFPDAGVGIRTDTTPAIDIDIYDKDTSDKLVAWLTERLVGTVVTRVGQAPKVLIPLRGSPGGRKRLSSQYKDPKGKLNRIEILRDGQQFVAYHVHPKTRKPYYYPGLSLCAVPREDLPEYSDALIDELFKYLEEIVPPSWVRKSDASTSSVPSGERDSLAALVPKLDLDAEEINAVLEGLPNEAEDYDTWLTVGMGLSHQFDNGREGYAKWVAWSSKSEKHVEAHMRKKWVSFAQTSGTPVTFASVLRLSNKARERNAVTQTLNDVFGSDTASPAEGGTLVEFLNRYAFMPENNSVVDLKRPITNAIFEIGAFRNLTANRRMAVPSPTAADPDREKLEPIHKFWLTHADRLTVEGTRYDPGTTKKIVRSPDGRHYLNVAHFPEWTKVKSRGDLSVFRAHMEYLIPDAAQREWFIQWLAFNIQRPSIRCKVTPLHVALDHGTGRGWVVQLIERLLGSWNVSKAKMEDLCGSGSKAQYDDYLHRSLVCAIEEVREGSKRFEVSDMMRDQLTEPRLNVNLKYGGKGTIDVYTNFFLMSNHEDALVIPSRDRRIHVLEGPRFLQPGNYYDTLYAWSANDANIAALWEHLSLLDLTKFEWKYAPMTAAKQRMIYTNLTTTEIVFNTWMEEMKAAGIEYVERALIDEHLGAIVQRDGHSEIVQVSQLTKLLKNTGMALKRMRLNGALVTPFALTLPDGEPDADLVKESMLKAQKYFEV